MNVQLSTEETYADILPVRPAGSMSTYLSIMRGCNNMCSFCIVPYTRGRERSRPLQSILEEVCSIFCCNAPSCPLFSMTGGRDVICTCCVICNDFYLQQNWHARIVMGHVRGGNQAYSLGWLSKSSQARHVMPTGSNSVSARDQGGHIVGAKCQLICRHFCPAGANNQERHRHKCRPLCNICSGQTLGMLCPTSCHQAGQLASGLRQIVLEYHHNSCS